MSSQPDSPSASVLPLADLKEELLDVLFETLNRPIETSVRSNVAFMQDIQAPNPCLDVQDGGIIGLPLTSYLGLSLIERWSIWPPPSSTSTAMHASVPSSALNFRNSRWDDWVSSAAASMVAKLGGPGRDFSCHFEKMMLLGEGYSQKLSIQAERTATFAHMSIILPSQAEGSIVKVKLNGYEDVIHCRTDNFETSVIAWPADATFEIQPITKGFQTVLSYHLRTKSGSIFKYWRGTRRIPSAPDRSEDEVDIASVLAKWRTTVEHYPGSPRSLLFILDIKCDSVDDYAGQHFGPFDERSQEQAFVAFIERFGTQSRFSATLGHLSLSVSGQASTNTYPEYNYGRDCWDEDGTYEHGDDVWLEFRDVDRSSMRWNFIPASADGRLDQSREGC